MFCRKCGKELKVGAQFCPYCGNRVSDVVQPKIEEEIIGENEEKKAFSLNENNDLSIITIVLLASSVILSILSIIDLGLAGKIVCLSLLFMVFVWSLLHYIFKRSKYDFFALALAISFVLFDTGMIIYIANL